MSRSQTLSSVIQTLTNQQHNLYNNLSFLSHCISTRTSDSLVLSIAMSDHHWTNGLPFSLVHDSGIPSLIPEIRIFHQARFQAQTHLNPPTTNGCVATPVDFSCNFSPDCFPTKRL